MKLKSSRTLSFLMAIVMVLTMMPFHASQARAAETAILNLGTPIRLSETNYQLSNAAFESNGIVNEGGGYFTVAVNNGSIAVGTLSNGITELTNGITISGVVTDKSTPKNRVFNFSSGTVYEEIQAVIRTMTFTQDSGQTQSVTVNVTPGAQLSNGKTSVRTYNGRHFAYVERLSTMTFNDAVTIAKANNGHLVEPTADHPEEMLAIARLFQELKTPWTGGWSFVSFIGATKTTEASSWSTPAYTETRYVTNAQPTGLELTSNYVQNGALIHLTLVLDTNNTKIGYVAVNNTHGGTSAYKDPGVIVEYSPGAIGDIITAPTDVASFTDGIKSVTSAVYEGSGAIIATPLDVSTVMSVTDLDGNPVTGYKAYDQNGDEITADAYGWYPSNGGPIVFKPLMPGGTYKVAASTTFNASITTPSTAAETKAITLPTVGDHNVAVGKDTGNPGKTTITINPSSTLAKYAIADAQGNVVSDWKTGTDSELTFENLDPATEYQIVTVPADTTGPLPTTGVSGTSVRTPGYSTMGGSVAISGTAQAGQTLTADLSGITYTPDTTEDVPTYQWYRDGVAISGATSASYALTEPDIGKPIAVKVTADGMHATGAVTSDETAPVTKMDGPAAPSAPVEAGKTATSISLEAVEGQEYSLDDGLTWQDSATFDGLTPGTDYTFVTRVKGTATQSPSAVSEATTIRTSDADLPKMGGVVSISGTAKYGETLTADLSAITYTSGTTEDVPAYMWYRDGAAISGATNASYTLTEDDIGKAITVKVIADGTHAAGSVTSAATASVAKMEGPKAPSAPVEAGKTATSITLTGIAGQEYSKDGGLTWQDSLTFNGLTPDTEYAFVTRVKETATQNASAISEAARIHTSAAASNGNNGGNNSGSTPTPTTPVPSTTPATPTNPVESGIKTSVNDKDGAFATGKTSTSGDRTTTWVQVDLNKLNETLAQGSGQKLAIRSPKDGDVKVDGLTAETVRQLADKGASLEISNPLAVYPVPGGKMNLDSVSKQLGNSALNEIAVQINISRSADTWIQNAKNKAAEQGYELLVNPVDLDLTFTNSGKTARFGQLSGYAPKYIALPEGIDPNRITTGVVINPDGSVFHVPTAVTKIDNRYFARINDLRSSGTYSVIWNPQDFDDVRQHWGKEDVNNIAARLDLDGTGSNTFSPNRNVKRSEFADIVVLGLGLMRQDVPQNIFPDVADSAWYRASVAIANEFGIVRGYNDGSFYGNREMTREQGFSMIARAYRLIDSGAALSDEQAAAALAGYKDASGVSAWAKADVAQLIAAEIIQGNGPAVLSPKAPMTRAEVTALIARMLKITNIIDK